MSATMLTVTGNLVANPEVRRLDGGYDRTTFTVASNERRPDDSGEWTDVAHLYVDVVCWRRLATHVAASLRKGDPVLVQGRLRTRHFTVDNQPRTRTELNAEAVGPDLTWGLAQLRRQPARATLDASPQPVGVTPKNVVSTDTDADADAEDADADADGVAVRARPAGENNAESTPAAGPDLSPESAAAA